MAMVPALAVAALRRWAPGGGTVRTSLLLGLTACAATLAGAALIVLEVSIGRSADQLAGIAQFAAYLLGAHALAGILEGVATVALVQLLVGLAAPDDRRLQWTPRRASLVVAANLAVALLAAGGWSSAAPDGYQAALAATAESGQALGQIEAVSQFTGVGAAVQNWQQSLVSAMSLPEAPLLLAATALAGLAAWLVARQCGRVQRSIV
jgi:hypothetical protein